MTILTNRRIKRLIQFCENKPQIDCLFFSINSLNLFDRIIRIRSLVHSRVIRAIHNEDLAILDEYFSIVWFAHTKEREDILSTVFIVDALKYLVTSCSKQPSKVMQDQSRIIIWFWPSRAVILILCKYF